MTGDKPGRIVLGGRPVHRLLADALPVLATAVVEQLVRDVPVYRSLPTEQLAGDVRDVVVEGIRTFVAMLRAGGRLPDAPRSAVRIGDGLTVDAVIGAHHVGALACLDHVSRLAGPQDLHQVVALHGLVLQYVRHTSAAITAAAAAPALSAVEARDARRALLAALLDGAPAPALAARAGLRLPERYDVVALRLGPHADELRDGVDPALAGRRKVRRLRRLLDRRAGPGTLTRLGPDGGVVLLPERSVDPDALVADLAAVAGADLVAAVVPAAPDGVADAARLADELQHVAAAVGCAPGLYRLADLALELQVGRPGPARDQLAALLDPAADRPELLRTARTHLRSGLQRRRTAVLLHVHPNTVDYRLRRLGELTGLDVGRPEHLLTLRAALVARDVRDADRGGNRPVVPAGPAAAGGLPAPPVRGRWPP